MVSRQAAICLSSRFQTADRPEDTSQRVSCTFVPRQDREPSAARMISVRSLDQSVLCQRAQDALKILLRQLLPLGDLPHGDKAAAMLRQIQQDQNRVAAHG